MQKLGITPSNSCSINNVAADLKKQQMVPIRSLLGSNPKITIEPLNDHAEFAQKGDNFWNFGSFLSLLRGEAEKSEPLASSLGTETSSISTSSRSEAGIGKRLTFHDEVFVCPIPRRDQYSNRIRHHLWPSMEELTNKAEKNTLEFASEGWDWRKTLDKEDMYLDTSSGEYIHPIHILIEQQQQAQSQAKESKGNNDAIETTPWR
jgi:hypothetical protein